MGMVKALVTKIATNEKKVQYGENVINFFQFLGTYKKTATAVASKNLFGPTIWRIQKKNAKDNSD